MTAGFLSGCPNGFLDRLRGVDSENEIVDDQENEEVINERGRNELVIFSPPFVLFPIIFLIPKGQVSEHRGEGSETVMKRNEKIMFR